MKRLPISKQGYPTPWFVGKVDGEYDFRLADPEKMYAAVKRNLCWLCGQPLGVHKVFVIGPMCVVNRVSSEPPSHLDCADYAARACPFLTKPRMRRNEADLPEDGQGPAGIMLKRNPGVAALWVTRKSTIEKLPNGILFRIGDPERIVWMAEGRTATRAEIDESIRTGLPYLEDLAEQDGPEAQKMLAAQLRAAEALLPAA